MSASVSILLLFLCLTYGSVAEGRSNKYRVLGGQTDEDPNDPKYERLASQAIQKYLHSNADIDDLTVTKVTSQIVAGTMIRIDFRVVTNGRPLSCHSKILERLDDTLDFKTNCLSYNKNKLGALIGGITVQDPSAPGYRALAKKSFDKYQKSHSGIAGDYKELHVHRVTTQVVSGAIIVIDFTVVDTDDSRLACHSKILQQPWLGDDQIDVECKESIEAGGIKNEDPDKPEYKQLANQAFEKYLESHDYPDFHITVFEVNKVTTQVVAGSLTRIDFSVHVSNDRPFYCHSEIWENLKKTDFTTTCNRGVGSSAKKLLLNKKKLSLLLSAPGQQQEQDPNDPQYLQLAEDTFNKFHQTDPIEYKKITVDKVTTQVVNGKLTRIDFTVFATNGLILKCNSQILDSTNLRELNMRCIRRKSN